MPIQKEIIENEGLVFNADSTFSIDTSSCYSNKLHILYTNGNPTFYEYDEFGKRTKTASFVGMNMRRWVIYKKNGLSYSQYDTTGIIKGVQYNTEGLLVEKNEYSAYFSINHTYDYNNNGKLVYWFTRSFDNYGMGDDYWYKYLYDSYGTLTLKWTEYNFYKYVNTYSSNEFPSKQVRYDAFFTSLPDTVFTLVDYSLYEYNESNNVSREDIYDVNEQLKNSIVYTYDVNQNLISKYFEKDTGILLPMDIYEYNSNNQVIKHDYYRDPGDLTCAKEYIYCD